MEFYDFVKNNNITSFEVLKKTVEAEPYFLKIKEDTKCPDLALFHSQPNSDFNLSIVRVCNGLIIDKNNFINNNVFKPSLEEAKFFSVESIYNEISFGIHKPWLYVNNDELDSLKKLFPELELLIESQGLNSID